MASTPTSSISSTSFPAKALVAPRRPKPVRSLSTPTGLSSHSLERPPHIALPVHILQEHAFQPLDSLVSPTRSIAPGAYFDQPKHEAPRPTPPYLGSLPPRAHIPLRAEPTLPTLPHGSSSTSSQRKVSAAPSTSYFIAPYSPHSDPPAPTNPPPSRARKRSIKAGRMPSSIAPVDLPVDGLFSFGPIVRSSESLGLPVPSPPPVPAREGRRSVVGASLMAVTTSGRARRKTKKKSREGGDGTRDNASKR